MVQWCEFYFEKLWIYGSFSFVDSVNLPWQMAALCNHQSSCCERLSIPTTAETISTSFTRSRYSHVLLLSFNASNTTLASDVCKRLCSIGICNRNQACTLWKRKKRPYRARCRHRGKTVDTIRQKHPLSLTRFADKLYFCFSISDSLLPTNLEGRVCLAQLSDRIDQLGISQGRHQRHRPARTCPYRGSRCKQGWIIPIIVKDTSWPRILHPLCTSTHASVQHHTYKCSTAYGISYSNLIRIDNGPFIH